LDCEYNTDEFESFNENLCNSDSNVVCTHCCYSGACATIEKCHPVAFMVLIAAALFIIILSITFCCLCRKKNYQTRHLTE